MQLDYHASAQRNKVYVVGACGFDSIPAEMGILFLEQKFKGQINSVEQYLDVIAEKVFQSIRWRLLLYNEEYHVYNRGSV